LAALVLVVIGLGLWQLLKQEEHNSIAFGPIEAINSNSQPTSPPGISPSPPPSASPVASASPLPSSIHEEIATAVFTLHAGTVRDFAEGEHLLKLSPHTKTIELRLALQNDEAKPYRVEIQTVEGQRVLGRPGLRAVRVNRETVLIVRAPTSMLSNGDYIGRVFDREGEPAASYVFRIAWSK